MDELAIFEAPPAMVATFKLIETFSRMNVIKIIIIIVILERIFIIIIISMII